MRAGSFADLPWTPIPEPGEVSGLARFSWLVREAVSPDLEVTEGDVLRWAGIVRSARQRVEARFPGCEFHVIFDDRKGLVGERMLAALEPHEFRLHRMSAILPGDPEEWRSWQLHERDVHPNAEAARVIGAYVAHEIVGDGSAPGKD